MRAARRPPDQTSTLAPVRVLRGGVDPRGPLRRRSHSLVPLGFCQPQRRDRPWGASRPPPASLSRVRHPLGPSRAMRNSVAGRAAVLPRLRDRQEALGRGVALGSRSPGSGNDRWRRSRHSRHRPVPACQPGRLAGAHTSTARGCRASAAIRRTGGQPDPSGGARADRGPATANPWRGKAPSPRHHGARETRGPRGETSRAIDARSQRCPRALRTRRT